jgi:hypothetical protein
MRVAEREEGMRETGRTREIRWTKEINNRIRFSLLRFIFSLDERVLFSCELRSNLLKSLRMF